MKKTEYAKYAEAKAKKSNIVFDTLKAFFFGGVICSLGQALTEFYTYLGVKTDNVKILVPSTLVFTASLLTGLGVFDNIAKLAGAGTLVPITGFANAVTSPALDSKNEGFVLGVGAKMFTVAGPVILFGISAGVIYGVVYWISTLF